MGRADKEVLEEKIKKGEEMEMKEKFKAGKEKIKKEQISFFTDFKKFITKGNVLDMAVAVVVATAFNAIVNGLVKQIITPLVTYFTSGVSINEWEYVLREEVLNAEGVVEKAKISIQYGLWLQSILDFLIIAFTVFVLVRVIKGMERKLNAKEIAKKEAEAAAQKAEADAKAAAEAAAAAEKAAKEQAIKDEFYANVREQAALLREIRDSVKK
ncbi:MAG: large conductance mechanosensitive channel protein MscL [Clostridia bacterium]|jgi:large conductance mechanosensitive channel|nr:large conductance mechanosensitive channel protein MscL [Clostridia bacterium]